MQVTTSVISHYLGMYSIYEVTSPIIDKIYEVISHYLGMYSIYEYADDTVVGVYSVISHYLGMYSIYVTKRTRQQM